MWTKLVTWLFGTAMGRGVLLGLSMTLGLVGGWYAFSTHYYEKGLAECRSQTAEKANEQNVKQGEQNAKNNVVSSEIGKTADNAAASVLADTQADEAESKETVDHVYARPPVTAPVSSCVPVHPVDDRVQQRIRSARLAATGA